MTFLQIKPLGMYARPAQPGCLLSLSLSHTKLPSSTPRDLALSQVTIGVAVEVVGG